MKPIIDYKITKTRGGRRIKFKKETMNLFTSSPPLVVIDFISFFLRKLKNTFGETENVFIDPDQTDILSFVLANYNKIHGSEPCIDQLTKEESYIKHLTTQTFKAGVANQNLVLSVDELWGTLSYFYNLIAVFHDKP